MVKVGSWLVVINQVKKYYSTGYYSSITLWNLCGIRNSKENKNDQYHSEDKVEDKDKEYK